MNSLQRARCHIGTEKAAFANFAFRPQTFFGFQCGGNL